MSNFGFGTEPSTAVAEDTFGDVKVSTVLNLESREQIDALKQEYKFNKAWHEKVDELRKLGYIGFRCVRGDGNCCYRAIGFNLLEQIATAPEPARRRWGASLRSRLQSLSFACPSQQAAHLRLISCVERLTEGKAWDEIGSDETAEDVLFRCLRPNESADDEALMRALRKLTAVYIVAHEDESEADGTLTYAQTCSICYGQSAAEWCRKEVEPLGKEAESFVLHSVPKALGIDLRIAYMDRNPTLNKGEIPMITYGLKDRPGEPPAGHVGGRPLIHVQLRPGHYDINYFKGTPKASAGTRRSPSPGKTSPHRDENAYGLDALLPQIRPALTARSLWQMMGCN
jgi:ubiquitin thioesterase protein OTUB1